PPSAVVAGGGAGGVPPSAAGCARTPRTTISAVTAIHIEIDRCMSSSCGCELARLAVGKGNGHVVFLGGVRLSSRVELCGCLGLCVGVGIGRTGSVDGCVRQHVGRSPIGRIASVLRTAGVALLLRLARGGCRGKRDENEVVLTADGGPCDSNFIRARRVSRAV